jgi:hypothetical protein
MTIRGSLLICFLVLSLAVRAQEDDTIRFVQGLPEAGTDSSLYDDVNLDAPPSHFQKVKATAIPDNLKDELESNALFSGWEKRILWRDKNTGLYWIDFAEGSAVRSYGLTADGNIVSVKEKTTTSPTNDSP